MRERIRKATIDDVDSMARVHMDAWRIAYRDVIPAEFMDTISLDDRIAGWRTALTDFSAPPYVQLVAEADDDVVGFVAGGPCRDEDYDGPEVMAIYVDPDHWRTGLGTHLLDAAVGRLRADLEGTVVLWVFEKNPRARAFYERHGWATDGGYREWDDFDPPAAEVRYRLS